MCTQKKKMRSSTLDKISCLPDEVREKILSRLPLQEAAQTSILSRKWRFVWRQIPEIIFDDLFCKRKMIDDEDKLMSTIDQVLLLHTGSILKFKFSLSKLVYHVYVDRVIYSVLKRGIKNFIYIGNSLFYEFPRSLFSCEQLEHLNLHHCVVKLPTGFKGFAKLVSLELCRVFIFSEVCSSLISSCPLLERLTLKDLSFVGHLEIVAPNLKAVRCGGISSCIIFRSTPRLESLSIILHKNIKEKAHEPIVLYHSLPGLQYLKLCDLSFKYVVVALMGSPRNRLASELNNLKVLKLYGVSFGNRNEALSVASLIKSCKNLTKLTIGTTSERSQGFWKNLGCSGISFDHLTQVKMKRVSGIKMELTFIEYVLATAPKLLNVVIVPETTSMSLLILKEVIQFRRESRLAKIIFIE